ncbi:hypothetical protein [Pseudoalteromonas sp. S554]|uniref:hypothetical protein n=1 Tax=Pseudoalteromonas sp. S554 TaxID=2066516 RepID=UPI00110D18AA|nr:hypothetical protein [Pseudoalteromonas sp. S554]TMS79563.1 hypothetical protein CWB65_19550 [Pseudoalteromonas sp. S554]
MSNVYIEIEFISIVENLDNVFSVKIDDTISLTVTLEKENRTLSVDLTVMESKEFIFDENTGAITGDASLKVLPVSLEKAKAIFWEEESIWGSIRPQSSKDIIAFKANAHKKKIKFSKRVSPSTKENTLTDESESAIKDEHEGLLDSMGVCPEKC